MSDKCARVNTLHGYWFNHAHAPPGTRHTHLVWRSVQSVSNASSMPSPLYTNAACSTFTHCTSSDAERLDSYALGHGVLRGEHMQHGTKSSPPHTHGWGRNSVQRQFITLRRSSLHFHRCCVWKRPQCLRSASRQCHAHPRSSHHAQSKLTLLRPCPIAAFFGGSGFHSTAF